MEPHPASEDELEPLRWFAGSARSIEASFQDNQDVLCNWSILGVHPVGDRVRVYVIERSTHAVAYVDGDGARFGDVGSPREPEAWAEFVTRHTIHI
jgi:hypothetical protein